MSDISDCSCLCIWIDAPPILWWDSNISRVTCTLPLLSFPMNQFARWIPPLWGRCFPAFPSTITHTASSNAIQMGQPWMIHPSRPLWRQQCAWGRMQGKATLVVVVGETTVFLSILPQPCAFCQLLWGLDALAMTWPTLRASLEPTVCCVTAG